VLSFQGAMGAPVSPHAGRTIDIEQVGMEPLAPHQDACKSMDRSDRAYDRRGPSIGACGNFIREHTQGMKPRSLSGQGNGWWPRTYSEQWSAWMTHRALQPDSYHPLSIPPDQSSQAWDSTSMTPHS
jgi:hypothetical protein